MSNYLDSSGLSHFWSKLKAILSGKQDSLTIGDGLSLKDNTIDVTDPVKGITKAEYDALSDEEKNSGLYILTDVENQASASGATFTPAVSEEGVISWTNDAELPNPAPVNIKGPKGEQGPVGPVGPKGDTVLDVYSTEETRIGTWIDGKPIYRKVIQITLPTTVKKYEKLGVSIANFDRPINLYGFFYYSKYGDWDLMPYASAVGENCTVYINKDGDLLGAVGSEIFAGATFLLNVEYTKTTDVATIPQATILISKVETAETLSFVSYSPASASSAKFNL